jgi:hypothetical protein
MDHKESIAVIRAEIRWCEEQNLTAPFNRGFMAWPGAGDHANRNCYRKSGM